MEALAHVRRVEVHVVVDTPGRLGHPTADGGGDHVARCQVLQRMDTGHHPLAGGVVQDRSLATHGLGHQCLLAGCVRAAPQHGGVELHELDVGDRQSRPQGDRHAVAGHGRRIRRGREHLAVATARDDHGPGGDDAHRHHPAVFVGLPDPDPGGLAGAIGRGPHHQIEREGAPQHVDAGTERRLVERPLDLGPRSIPARVHDPVVAVAALAGEGDVAAVELGVERSTEPHEVADRLRCLLHQLAHDRLVAQAGAGLERVADVAFGGIGGVQHRRQPALRPLRRSCRQDVLGDDQHAAHRPYRERCRQPRRTGSQHHDVDVALPGRCRRRQPPREVHVTRRWTTGCRWRSSARPTAERDRRCRRAR